MGEKDAESVIPESVANGNVEMEEMTEPVMEKKEEQHDGITEMEEENKVSEKIETNSMDMDKEKANDGKDTEEKEKIEDAVNEGEKDERMEDTEEEQQVAEEKVEMEIEEMNHDPGQRTEAEDQVEDKVDGLGEEEKPKESKEERGPKNRLRTKSVSGKKDKSKNPEVEEESNTPMEKKHKDTKTSTDKKEDPNTPVAFKIDRPVRERKSVERLVAIIEQDAAKEFKVEKGRGTALKDIPNVAYKLSRKTTDDTFKLLHNILFGRRGKAAQIKNNISKFSGFVWHDDEEKQTLKVREKLDKIFKEKLVEFCDVLDIPIAATIRKEDIVAKLIEFLLSPHATTTESLAEKGQSSKGEKRKRVSKSEHGSITPSEGSAKSQKKTKGTSKKDSGPKPEDESEEETHDEDDINSGSERSGDEISEPAEHEEKASGSEQSDKDKRKKKQGSAKSSAKKGSAVKAKTKKVTFSEETNLRSPKKKPAPTSHPKNKEMSAKRSSGTKKDESIKEKTSTPKKDSSSAGPGKKILKVKGNLEEKLKPSDDELKNAICEILKEVDFNTATFTDILKLLAKQFSVDLMPRKPSIKLMMRGELAKIADAEEADDDKDEKKPSSKRVKA